MLKLKPLIRSLIAGLFILNISIAFAGVVSPSVRISGTLLSPVTTGTPAATATLQVSPLVPSGAYKDVSVLDKITFGVDHSNMNYFPLSKNIRVTIRIDRWDINNTPMATLAPVDLTLQYQPFSITNPYVDKAIYNFTGVYKYKITIIEMKEATTSGFVSVTTLQSNLFIDAEIQLERYTDFSAAASQPISIASTLPMDLDCDNVNEAVQINWQTIAGAEEYQLEWTFVNDYNASIGSFITPTSTNLPFDFKSNSTRVTSVNTSYNITLAFEHGYLLYRVRGVGRDLTDPSKNIIGVWSLADVTGKGYVVSVPSSNKYYNQQEHEANKNWQYSATYAEEGKKKEVISYFDGSLRNRQSVTKVNSDKNTIVGETIYDHQGRPAVNVLPVPVQKPICSDPLVEPSIKYYPNFNIVDGGTASYNRENFDWDTSPADFCSAKTVGMNVSSGASNYYSPANPNKAGAQAFVPDGKKFPFTQIEYTPDNTGRIRRQGGVGPDYQLGSTHETKYFYGWPNQIQLDRMFGSEVGDASHYKKNMVVDANGQVSVSYLDQEGRTIATSLAGNAPTSLAALPSEPSAVKVLTIDLFAKDANGKSNVNTKSVQGNAIEFNSQLLVAYQSDYEFNYTLTIDTVYDACLKSGICFNCIYDLEIKVTDDCGINVTALSGIHPLKKTIGNFNTNVNGVISFNTICTAPSTELNESGSFKLNLPIGNYTISKTLTLNSDARDFYVKSYLETAINPSTQQEEYVNLNASVTGCGQKTLQSFVNEALANLDAADCDISCELCATSLQTINGTYYATANEARDAYVAAGNGTELDFDFLLEECGSPCKETSVCETTYNMLLMDVSPDGQYGEFQPKTAADGTELAPDLALSVLSVNNVLPKNSAPSQGNWQHPSILINGIQYQNYLEENGTRSIIHLSIKNNQLSTPILATDFIPAIVSVTNAWLKYDATGGFYYTYPENLADVNDFVANWTDNWAKSLVQYHPEYCYYQSYIQYSQKQTGFLLTSDEFDIQLAQTETFAQAVINGLVTNAAMTFGTPSTGDPFVSNLSSLITNYKVFAGTNPPATLVSYSMAQMAAIAARCGTQYGSTPPLPATCTQFGQGIDNAIKDQEWNLLKNFYLSEKQKLQKQKADDNAKIPNGCNGYNGCIGNASYNPFASGMINSSGVFYSSPSYSQFFNPLQPCGASHYAYYLKKKKRFNPESNLTPPSAEETDYQVYLQTGECPLAKHLEYLLTTLASQQKLITTGLNLQTIPEFTQDLYKAVSGGIMPTTFIPYTWTATQTTDVLIVNINNSITGLPVCTFKLDKTGTGITSWNSVKAISQLKYTITNGSNYEFTATAAIENLPGALNQYSYKTITGSSCIKITGCNFTEQCKANDLANDLSNLWSALVVNNQLASTFVNLNASPTLYSNFITTNIKSALGTTNNTLIWNYKATASQFELFDNANPAKKLVIKFTGFDPGTYTNTNLFSLGVKAFTDIKGDNQNLFTVNGVDAGNGIKVKINGTVNLVQNSGTTSVSMGNCGLPTPVLCKGDAYQLRTDIEALLKDGLLKKPFNLPIDLTQSAKYTNLISYYAEPSTEKSGSAPQGASKYDKFVINSNNDYKEQLYFNLKCECNIIISHKGKANLPLLFSDLSSFGKVTGYGAPAFDNNYYTFYALASYLVNGQTYQDTIFGESCLPIKNCNPVIAPDTIISPTVPYANPCILYQINLAHANAENAYQEYTENLTSEIAEKYNKHCMNAFENFSAKYNDKEYHFTLYYYDQAGNLVRTIPPEGVNLVPMNAANALQINEDRTNNQHTFFTEHTMPTTYQYNSLNQLVRQNMPDHDLMDIWDYTLPSGLDSRLKVTATQFVNSTKGYLSGYVDINPSPPAVAYKRGYLYATEDGGATWTKMNDLVASNLKKVQMVDAGNGYAVGTNGIILKTIDGGTTWDMLTTYAVGFTGALNDLYFFTSKNGIIVGDNGKVFRTNDGGSSFTSQSGTIPAGVNLNSITYDGNSLFIAGTDLTGLTGIIYKGIVSNPNAPIFSVAPWQAAGSIRSTDLNKIQMLDASNGFAIGVDGTLLKTTNSGTNWTTIATGISTNFRDVHFKTITEGLSIIESGTTGQIYKTTDGGNTWALLSVAGEDYNSFNFYQNDKGYAVGNNGKIKRLVIISANPPNVSAIFGLVNIPTASSTQAIPVTTNLTAAYFTTPDKGWVVSNTSATAYYTINATNTYPNWLPLNTGITGGIKDICFDNGIANGIALSTAGVLYKIVSGVVTSISPGNEVYSDIDDNTTNIYGFNKTTGVIKFVAKANVAGTTNLPNTFGVAMPGANTSNVVSINAKVSNTVFTAGKNGDLFKATTTLWTDNSKMVSPLAINDIQAAGANTIYAVGAEGTLLQTTNGTDWKTLPTATIIQLNAIKFNKADNANPAATVGLIAGNNGNLWKQTGVTLTPIILTTSDNLYDIALNISNKAYVTGANGTMVSIPNIIATVPAPVIASLHPAASFRGVCFKPGGNSVYTVGDNAAVYNYNNTSGAKIKSVFTPALNDVNFITAQNGYTVGEKGTIRHTGDGGVTWSFVLPVNSTGGSNIPTLNGVWTTSPNSTVIIGTSGYLANIGGNAGNTVTYNSTVVTTNDLFDVAIKPNGKGYIVGANGAVYKTNNSGTTWSVLGGTAPPTSTLRALHIFKDNSFMTVGDQKKIYYFNGVSWITHSPPTAVAGTTVFTDVFFHDDRSGYVVGSGGVVLKCALTANISTLGNTTNSWQIRPLTGVNGVPTPLLVNVTTIDFASRYSGFLGGYFNDNRLSANYARLVNDESNIFSTRFWYDRLGRMVVSQNTKQYNRKNLTPQSGRSDYSYTLYDDLGRIKEVGETTDNTTVNNFASIFGTAVNGQFNPNLIDDSKLNLWINAGVRREVTHTYYDNTAITGLPITQDNLRKRVASVTYEDVDDSNPQTFQHATDYSYDIHGNVKTLIQENPTISISGQQYKKIDYEYDLISGNVNTVKYQDGQPDAFFHHYEYDADNRLTNVYSSKYPNAKWTGIQSDPMWDQDEKLFYYLHGPLARVELGDEKVQGLDYIYTIQGWLKGCNSNNLNASNDMGQDGETSTNNLNKHIGRDAYGYSLNYFSGDYQPIGTFTTQNNFIASATAAAYLSTDAPGLFNGNISSMVTSLTDIAPGSSTLGQAIPQLTAYRYDQLNRVKQMKAYRDMNLANNAWGDGSTYDGSYETHLSYDANGNILTMQRNGVAGVNVNMDNLNYIYETTANGYAKNTNKLRHVNDNTSYTNNYQTDIDDQGTFSTGNENYDYDEIGQQKQDKSEGIASQEWNVYGKVKSITRYNGSTKPDLEFNYNASGQRISKIVKPRDANGQRPMIEWITTHYVKDAQGNTLAVYEQSNDPQTQTASFKLKERYMYGSNRLGADKTEVEMIGAPAQGNTFSRTLGNKTFDLTDSRGDIISVVADRKIGVEDTQNPGTVAYYKAEIITTSETYLFGQPMPGRNIGLSNDRHGYQGQEKVDEINGKPGTHYTADYWEYNVLTGRRENRDPKPDASISDYATFANNPIWFTDVLGDKPGPIDKIKGWVNRNFLNKTTSGIKLGDRKTETHWVLETKKQNIVNEDRNLLGQTLTVDKKISLTSQQNVSDYQLKFSGLNKWSAESLSINEGKPDKPIWESDLSVTTSPSLKNTKAGYGIRFSHTFPAPSPPTMFTNGNTTYSIGVEIVPSVNVSFQIRKLVSANPAWFRAIEARTDKGKEKNYKVDD